MKNYYLQSEDDQSQENVTDIIKKIARGIAPEGMRIWKKKKTEKEVMRMKITTCNREKSDDFISYNLQRICELMINPEKTKYIYTETSPNNAFSTVILFFSAIRLSALIAES